MTGNLIDGARPRRVLERAGILALPLVAVVAAACGSSTTKPTTAQTRSTPAPQAASAATSPVVSVITSPQYGKILTTAAGAALYVYTADLAGGPGCDSNCLKVWPPLLLAPGTDVATGAAGVDNLGTVRRNDRLQVTYHDLPLYTYVKDVQPNEVTGQDVVDAAGKWIVATVPLVTVGSGPAGSAAHNAPATVPTTKPAASSQSGSNPATVSPTTATPPPTCPVTTPSSPPPSPPSTGAPTPTSRPPTTQPPSTSPPTTQDPPTTAPPTTQAPPTTTPGLPSY